MKSRSKFPCKFWGEDSASGWEKKRRLHRGGSIWSRAYVHLPECSGGGQYISLEAKHRLWRQNSSLNHAFMTGSQHLQCILHHTSCSLCPKISLWLTHHSVLKYRLYQEAFSSSSLLHTLYHYSVLLFIAGITSQDYLTNSNIHLLTFLLSVFLSLSGKSHGEEILSLLFTTIPRAPSSVPSTVGT